MNPEEREFLLGDMEEEYLSLRSSRGRLAAWCWYWFQVVRSALASFSSRPEPPRDPPRRSLGEVLVFEVRNAFRSLRRTPTVTGLAVVTLALGVGANTAMLGLVDALLFRVPEHVEAPHRIVNLENKVPNFVRYLELRDGARTVDVAAHTKRELGFGSGPDASAIAVECVTHTYLPLLGARPELGRVFTEEEDVEDGKRLVVLAYGLWQRRFGADPGTIGETVRIAGRRYTVVGVMPRGFTGVSLDTVDAWILLRVSPEACSLTGRNLLSSTGGAWLDTLGRLRNEATLDQAEAEIRAFEWSQERYPGEFDREPRGRLVRPMYGGAASRLSRQSRVALWLAGGAAVVFLIACLNVAGLLSIRGLQRRRELAVRRQLGASRGRVGIQLLLETLMLAALCGAVAGIVAVGMRLLVAGFFPLRPADHLLDARLLGAMVGFTFLAGLLSGAVPALQGSRFDPAKVLRGGFSLGADGSRLRNVMLVGQVALSLVLLICAGLFVRSVDNLTDDPGYDWERVVVATLDLQRSGFGQDEIWSIFDRLRDRVRDLEEVESASIGPPILGSGGPGMVAPLRTSAEGETTMAMRSVVSADYFTTLGTHIVAGRAFRAGESGRPAVVLDEELARTLWPDQEPLGNCVFAGFSGDACLEVVGITEKRRHSDLRRSPLEYFVPVAGARARESPYVPTTLLVRTRTSPGEAAARVAVAIHRAEPDLPFVDVRPLAELVSEETRSWRLGASMFGLFGILAVLLGAVGIYGLLALSVRQQAPAIGVRMVLGATPGEVVRGVLSRGVGLLATGLGLGVAAAWATTRYVESLLYEVAPTDVPSLVGALAVVTIASLAGCVVPAARAARVDPAVSLRTE